MSEQQKPAGKRTLDPRPLDRVVRPNTHRDPRI